MRFLKSFGHDSLHLVLTRRSLKYKRLVNDASIAQSIMKWSGTDAEIRYRRIWRLVRSNINVEIAALRPIGLAVFIPYPVPTLTHENQMSSLILI